MKNIFLFLFIIVALGCKATNDPKIISPNDLHDMVHYLALDSLNGRRTGSEGIGLAAQYIEGYLESIGIKPYYETYRDHFNIENIEADNIIGFLEGTDPLLKKEIVILSAHYDHIGVGQSIKKFGGRLTDIDSLANGANDNATGVATVLSMAKHLARQGNYNRSIMVVLFAGEEFGLVGSKHLSQRLMNEGIDLYTMVNFEMTGVPFTDNRGYDVFLSGFDISNMALKMNEYIGSNFIGKSEIAVKYQLFKASDNYPFYEVFKAPCQTISSCDITNYDYYHHADDEADKLDYEHMAKVVNALIPAIETLANSPTKEIKMKHE